MAKYRNTRIDAEMQEDDFNNAQEKILQEPAVTEEEESWKKRYGDLRRHQQERDAQHRQEIEDLRRTLDGIKEQQSNLTPPKSKEELEAWMKAYPDFAAINQTMIQNTVESILKKEGIDDLKTTQKKIRAEEALMNLRKLHPKCDEWFAPNSDFHEWMQLQPKKHQDFIYRSYNVDDAALVLDRYQLYLDKKNDKSGDVSASNRDTARSVRTKSEARAPNSGTGDYLFSESQIAKATQKWWDENESAVLDAQRKGKVLMDISGGAR